MKIIDDEISTKEAAKILNKSEYTIRRYIANGIIDRLNSDSELDNDNRLKNRKAGLIISRSSVMSLLKSNKKVAAATAATVGARFGGIGGAILAGAAAIAIGSYLNSGEDEDIKVRKVTENLDDLEANIEITKQEIKLAKLKNATEEEILELELKLKKLELDHRQCSRLLNEYKNQ